MANWEAELMELNHIPMTVSTVGPQIAQYPPLCFSLWIWLVSFPRFSGKPPDRRLMVMSGGRWNSG